MRSLLCSVWVLVLLAAAPGCGHAAAPPPPDGSAPGLLSCSAAFAPDEALRGDVAAAGARWAAATGCSIEVSDVGIPVLIVASIVRPDGTQAPGMTTPARDRVEINVRMRGERRASSVFHELGHALGGDHTASGILSGEKTRADVIDAASLASVCARLACPAFIPEAW